MAPPDAIKAPGIPVVPIALAIVAAAIVSVALAGGIFYWMARSGHLPVAGGSVASTAPATAKAAVPAAVAIPKSHPVVLEPLLVNLADQGGTAYLRVSITLRVLDDVPVKGEKPKDEKPEKGKPAVDENEAAVRDTALDVIGRMSAVELLQTDGKDKLKHRLTQAIAQRVPELKVTGIFFTEFLVQQ